MSRHRLTVPGLPPDTLCETCGKRNDAHNVRHPFKSSAEPIDPWEAINEIREDCERRMRIRGERIAELERELAKARKRLRYAEFDREGNHTEAAKVIASAERDGRREALLAAARLAPGCANAKTLRAAIRRKANEQGGEGDE